MPFFFVLCCCCCRWMGFTIFVSFNNIHFFYILRVYKKNNLKKIKLWIVLLDSAVCWWSWWSWCHHHNCMLLRRICIFFCCCFVYRILRDLKIYTMFYVLIKKFRVLDPVVEVANSSVNSVREYKQKINIFILNNLKYHYELIQSFTSNGND